MFFYSVTFSDIICIITTVCVAYLNKIVANFHDRVYINTPTKELPYPVYDLWFSNFSAPLIEHHYLPDLSLLVMFCLAYQYITYITLMHFVRVYRFVYIVRCLCIATTSGYVSYRKKEGNHLQVFGANSSYTDLVISGHTMTAMLLFCVIYDSECSEHYLVISSLTATMSVVSNLLVGDHYVSDLVIAIALSCLAYYSPFFR